MNKGTYFHVWVAFAKLHSAQLFYLPKDLILTFVTHIDFFIKNPWAETERRTHDRFMWFVDNQKNSLE